MKRGVRVGEKLFLFRPNSGVVGVARYSMVASRRACSIAVCRRNRYDEIAAVCCFRYDRVITSCAERSGLRVVLAYGITRDDRTNECARHFNRSRECERNGGKHRENRYRAYSCQGERP